MRIHLSHDVWCRFRAVNRAHVRDILRDILRARLPQQTFVCSAAVFIFFMRFLV